MSDALCGPSNPLQQFTKQSSLDRTLQQDRLTSRQSPAQGFRSHDPNAGLLDPEFEAFQAGLPTQDLQHFQPFPQPQQTSFAGPSQQQQLPSWATDFQRMQISPSPIHQQQQGNAAWAQGFKEHVAQQAPRAQQTSSPTPLAFQQQARYGYQPRFQSHFAHQQPSFQPNVLSAKGKEPVLEEFDDAAFEAAFDQARHDMMVDEAATTKMSQQEAEQHAHEVVDGMLSGDGQLRPDLKETLMQDDIAVGVQEEQSQEQQQQQEDDALAATAQELLQKVQKNQTDKFKNSQFLGLMRKLVDREVKVEGDKMVETETVSIPSVPIQSYKHAHNLAGMTYTPSLKDERSTSPHDSSYGSGENTPMTDAHHFDTHICKVPGCPSATPAYQAVDSRPLDYGTTHIPYEQQDHDSGRTMLQQPQDGQEVVDLLDEPTYDVGNDIGTSLADSTLPEGAPFYDDGAPGHDTRGDLGEMLLSLPFLFCLAEAKALENDLVRDDYKQDSYNAQFAESGPIQEEGAEGNGIKEIVYDEKLRRWRNRLRVYDDVAFLRWAVAKGERSGGWQ
ncbi:peroxin 20 [Teratosphaeria destructans]|uniref:Peroxin 20 n=1 Tax=Teratosphaeria destructans TaxID=418781 RepID=A0A9W7T119_9PEZI|nr:peroxin 20 [Teratosphaeria destructans]